MPESRLNKVVYLFGAGATHAELENVEGPVLEERSGLLISNVSARVIEKAISFSIRLLSTSLIRSRRAPSSAATSQTPHPIRPWKESASWLFLTFPKSHQTVSTAPKSFNPLDFRQRHSNPARLPFFSTYPFGFRKLAGQRGNHSRKPFLFTAKLPLPSSPPFTPSKLPFNPQFLPFPVRYFTLSLIHATLVHVPLDNLPWGRFRFSQRPQLLCVQPIPAPLSSRAQRRFRFSPPAPHLPLITRHSPPMSFPWHSFVPRCGLGYEPGDQPAFLY